MNLMFGRSGILRNSLSTIKLLFKEKTWKQQKQYGSKVAAKIFKSSAFAAKAALLATLLSTSTSRSCSIDQRGWSTATIAGDAQCSSHRCCRTVASSVGHVDHSIIENCDGRRRHQYGQERSSEHHYSLVRSVCRCGSIGGQLDAIGEKIRSSVFVPVTDGRHEFRLWRRRCIAFSSSAESGSASSTTGDAGGQNDH